MQQLTEIVEEPPQVTVASPTAGPTLAELAKALRRGSVEEKIAAAGRLGQLGREAVLPLCAALRDRDVRVRAAAADALGVVGDERAIPELVRALKALFPGGSPFREKVMWIFLAVTTTVVALAAVVALFMGGAGEVLGALGNIPTFSTGEKAAKEPPAMVIARALAQIAERSPTPELRKALPALRELADDGLLRDKRTRAVSRAAAKRIEASTAGLESLPLPATAPELDPVALPRPVDTDAAGPG